MNSIPALINMQLVSDKRVQIASSYLPFLSSASDSPPHVPPDELSTDIVIQVISNMTQTIRQHFPNLTVYPALGNHDYWPQVI